MKTLREYINLIESAEQGVAEGINFYDRFGHDIMPQDRKKAQPRLGDVKVKMPGRSPDTKPPKDKKPVREGQDNTIYQVSRAMLDNNPGKSYLKASEDDILSDAARELSRMGMSDIRVRAIMRDPDFAGELIDTLRGPIKPVREGSAHPQDDMQMLEYYRVRTPYGQEYVGQLMARWPETGIELRLPDGHKKWISRPYIQSVEWLDWKDPMLRSKKDMAENLEESEPEDPIARIHRLFRDK